MSTLFILVVNGHATKYDSLEDAEFALENEENLDEYRWYKDNSYVAPRRSIREVSSEEWQHIVAIEAELEALRKARQERINAETAQAVLDGVIPF